MKKIILLFIFMLPCIIFAKTIEQLRKEANQGSIDAMVELAIAYCKGNGISQNFNIGADWFRKASN